MFFSFSTLLRGQFYDAIGDLIEEEVGMDEQAIVVNWLCKGCCD